MQEKFDSPRFWFFLIVGLCLLIFLIRITGPTDLEGYAQHRNVGYVMDMMWQGSWLAQYDIQERILSKPPLHTWLIAPFAAVFGVDRLAMTLPSMLAVLGLALLVFETGRQRFGLLAGGLAGLAVVLAPTMSKHIALVRSDPIFTLTITMAAFAAFYAWEKGRGWWTVFWISGALAMLIKGPLGLLIAVSGLLAYFWEKRTDPDTPRPRGSHLPGILIFLVLTLGWFLPAWWYYGQELIDKIILDELLGHSTGAGQDSIPGENLPRPVLFLLARFLPFSLFVYYALWRVYKYPSTDPGERRFERFLWCWIVAGLVMFSFGAHFRPDHLLPLWPACALLAGRELARIAQRVGYARFARWSGAVVGLLLATVVLTYQVTMERRAERTEVAEGVRSAAEALAASEINPAQLHHVNTPVTFQMYLGTYRPWVSDVRLEHLLATLDQPEYFAAESLTPEDVGLTGEGRQVEEVFVWPEHKDIDLDIRVYRVSPLQQ